MVPQTFIFMGRSGCGKGTQAELLRKYLDSHDKEGHLIFHLEMGARFREFIARDNFTSKMAKKISDQGGLLPDFLAVWTWSDILVENFTNNEHLIIDGAPRSLPQARVLDGVFKFYDRPTPFVIYLNVSKDWSIHHLKRRGRTDDLKVEDIERRLAWFDMDAVPAIEFFKNNPDYHYVEIDGEQTVEKVHYDIIEKTLGRSNG